MVVTPPDGRPPVRLRLYHHHDGARVAYRETGTGPGLALLHSGGLTHREFQPVIEHLSDRFRLVLPDLPAHGDSEDRPRHPYTPEWLTDVMAGFCRDTVGAAGMVGGRGAGAELLLRALAAGHLEPARAVLMPNRMHGPTSRPWAFAAWRLAARAGGLPGADRALSHAAEMAFRPELGDHLSARGDPGARDLMRHAFADVGGNSNRARCWAKLARSWSQRPERSLLDVYPGLPMPILLLWADHDASHPVTLAEEALVRLPRGELRVLADTGHLMAYDDPVGLARELGAFCGGRR